MLKPAFKKARNLKALPSDDRWVCTIELAKKKTELVPGNVSKGLDALLTHFELGARDPE